jgi:hypothetical protein
MKKVLLAASAAVSALALASTASAAVIGSQGQVGLPFATLSSAGLNGGTLATLSGGAVLTTDQVFADIPEGVFGGTFLAAGPTVGQPAVLTFTQFVNQLGFLIGSPDTYNQLAITSTSGTFNFTPTSLGMPANGDQSLSQYVNFQTTTPGEAILSVSFTNSPSIDAFETSNFAAGVVPEPATWAMMLVGFGLLGGAMRRRPSNTTVTGRLRFA